MNGVENIRDRILRDAEAEAARILKDAEDKAAALLKKKDAEAQERAAKLAADYDERSAEQKKRLLAVAQLDMRKNILTAKQDMLEKAFARCLQMIGEKPGGEYNALIEELLSQAAVTGTETVVFSSRDEVRLDKGLLSRVNSRLSAQGKTAALRADSGGDFEGGFILRSGGMELNYTFDAMLRIIRDDIETKVAEMLF